MKGTRIIPAAFFDGSPFLLFHIIVFDESISSWGMHFK